MLIPNRSNPFCGGIKIAPETSGKIAYRLETVNPPMTAVTVKNNASGLTYDSGEVPGQDQVIIQF
jgi:hypothetical protein